MKLHGNSWLKLIDKTINPLIVLLLGVVIPRKNPPLIIERILIINISVLGDSLLLVPLLQAIHRSFPSMSIDLLVAQENWPVYQYEKFYRRIEIFSITRIPRYLMRAVLQPYHAVVDTGQWVRLTACLTILFFRSWKVGFNTPGQRRHYGFDYPVPHLQGHWEFYQYSRLVSFLPLEWLSITPHLHYPDQAVDQHILQLIVEHHHRSKLITIHPGAGNLNKTWKYYYTLIHYLLKNTAYHIVVTGKSEDRLIDYQTLRHPRLLNLQDKTNLYTLNEVIKRSDLFICGNTGPLYLAAFEGKKVITIPGPVSDRQWFWPNPQEQCLKSERECYPCVFLGFEYQCPSGDCLKDVSLQVIIAGITRVLESTNQDSLMSGQRV